MRKVFSVCAKSDKYVLIPEDKFQKIKEFLASSNFQNHSSEIKLIPEDIKETTKQN